MRICLKITKMARPHKRPMSKRPDCYELKHHLDQRLVKRYLFIRHRWEREMGTSQHKSQHQVW